MKVFVINRKKDIERREYIIEHFAEVGINDYEFFEAVEGVNVSKDFILSCNDWFSKSLRLGANISAGEIGCALSHLSIYNKMLEDKIKAAIIFEDDVTINDNNLLEITKNITNSLDSQSPNILHFGKYKSGVKILDDLIKLNSVAGTYSYYINNVAAENILNFFEKTIFVPIDRFKFMIAKNVVNVFSYKKELCFPNEKFDSTIDVSMKRKRPFWKKKYVSRFVAEKILYKFYLLSDKKQHYKNGMTYKFLSKQ